MRLLTFVLPLVNAFQHGEPGLFRVGIGKRLKLHRRIKSRHQLSHRLLARRAMRQWLGRKRTAQREPAAAHLAIALAQFVFVNWHWTASNSEGNRSKSSDDRRPSRIKQTRRTKLCLGRDKVF